MSLMWHRLEGGAHLIGHVAQLLVARVIDGPFIEPRPAAHIHERLLELLRLGGELSHMPMSKIFQPRTCDDFSVDTLCGSLRTLRT